MIDVKDLMVGNWYHDDKYDAITTLTPNLAYQHILNTCSGIPVTKEILKKIGFKEDTALVQFYRYWDKDYKYKLDVDEGYTNSGRMWSIHIDNDVCNTIGSGEFDYVHELQNLVRIITGHSLPITIEMIYGLGNDA
jgi:hypothetical protein